MKKTVAILVCILVALVYTMTQFTVGNWGILVPFVALLVALAITVNSIATE